MAHQPWIKFYLRDWDADSELASCSLAARGLWLHMIRVMHEATPYGHFVGRDGAPIDPKAFARRIGVSLAESTRLIKELETAGVFSRDRKGRAFSRRLLRDDEKRLRGKSNGQMGGNPTLLGLTDSNGDGITTQDNSGGYPPRLKPKFQKPEARVQSNLVRFAHSLFSGDPTKGLTPADPPWLAPLIAEFAAMAGVELRALTMQQRVVIGRIFAVIGPSFSGDEAKNAAKGATFAPVFTRMGGAVRFADLTARQYALYAWKWREVVGKPYHNPFDAEAAIEYEVVKR